MTLEELKVLISAEVAPLQKGIKKATSSLNNFNKQVQRMGSKWNSVFSQMGRIARKFLSAAFFLKIGKDALQAASDLEEWQNVVNVAFGSATNDINEWAKTLDTKFGLVEIQAKKMSATFKSMADAQNVSNEKGIIMAKNLTQLAADMASFYNITDAEQVGNDLESVFSGMTLSLKKYGIVLTEANLNQFAFQKGITKTYNEMSQAEKATLRYNYVMAQMSKVQGDFSRTSMSWANQVRILKENWIQLLGLWGDALKTILTPLLALLNNLAVAAIRVAQAIAAIFGKKIQYATGGVSNGFEDITDNIDDATGAAKEFKAQLASFDELDILKEDKGGGGSGLAGLGGGFDVGDLYDVEDTEMIDGIKLLNEKLEEWNKKLKENYDKMVEAASEWGRKFNDAFLRIRWDLIGEVLANGLDIITGSINAFIDALNLDAFGRKFAEMFNHFFQELNWVELGKTWGNRLKILADVLYGFFDDLDWSRIAVSIETAFQAMFDRIPWEKLGLTFAKGLNGITTIIMEWSENFPIRDYINHIWTAIKTAFENVDWKQLGQSINKLIIQMFNALQDIDYTAISNKIHDFLVGLNIGQIIKEFIETELDIRGEFWAGVFSLPEGVVKSWLVFKDVLGLVMKAITVIGGSSVLTNLLLFFKGLGGVKVPTALTDFFKTGIPTIISSLGKWLKNGIPLKSVFESIKDIVGGFIVDIKGLIGGLGQWIVAFFKANWVYMLIAAVAGIFVDLYKNNEEFRAKVQKAWEGIKEIITNVWNAIKPIFDLIVNTITNTLIPLIKTLYEGIIQPIVKGVLGLLLDLWNNYLQPFVNWVVEVLGTWIEMFSTFFDWIINSFLGGLIQKIGEFLGFLKDDVVPNVELTKNGLFDIIMEHKEEIFTFLTDVWNKIQEIWNAIKGWIEPLWTSIKDAGVGAFNLLKDGIGSALDGIKSAFSAAWSFIVDDTVGKFSTLVEKIAGAVSKIGSSIDSMLSRVASGISSAWSSISSFVSSALSKLASVVIPHFANGGVLDRPTVGLMGEYAGARTNPEIVTPESKMREVFNEGNEEIAALLERQNAILMDLLEKDNSITIGDDVISASAARGNRNYKLRTGRSQFAL